MRGSWFFLAGSLSLSGAMVEFRFAQNSSAGLAAPIIALWALFTFSSRMCPTTAIFWWQARVFGFFVCRSGGLGLSF
jgi:hypothetical protein